MTNCGCGNRKPASSRVCNPEIYRCTGCNNACIYIEKNERSSSPTALDFVANGCRTHYDPGWIVKLAETPTDLLLDRRDRNIIFNGEKDTYVIDLAEVFKMFTVNELKGGGRIVADVNWGDIAGSLSDQTDLYEALSNKVDVEEGKGLSTNDYTDEDKARLADVETGLTQKANTADLSSVAFSGAYSDLSGKPTNLSDFTNDENFQTDVEVSTSISNAVTPIDTAINKTVVTDLSIDSTPSATTVSMNESKQNIKTGATSSSSLVMPVASSSQAGIMNSATFDAVQSNANNINAILNGSVAISGLPSSPTKAQLTTAWQTATGLSTLINTAKIYDSTNEKIWTYYENVDQWYYASASGSVTVNQWTNSAAGIVKGSTTDGQIFAEADGTGSVNGWDTMANAVATNTSNIANKVDKEAGKGLSTNDYTTTEKNKLSGIATGAEANVLEGVQVNGTDLAISGKKVDIQTASTSTFGVVKSPAHTFVVLSQAEYDAIVTKDTNTFYFIEED